MSGITKLLLSAALPILSWHAFAQPSTTPPLPLHSLLVNVLDRNGNAVRNLAKDNFRVRINKKPAAVIGAEYSLAPRRIVVLLDMSRSMEGIGDTGKWQIARVVVEDLLAQTPANVPIALVTFSDHVQDVFELRENREAILRWFREGPTQRSSLKGRTALLDAVMAGIKMFQPARAGDAIYAITDGDDNASHVSLNQTKAALREAGVRLFGFLFADPTPFSEEKVDRDSLAEMAGDSGGFVFGMSGRGWSSMDAHYADNAATREKIKLSTQAFNIQLNGFYTVQVAAIEQRGKASKVSLEVVDGAGQPRKDMTFTYQRALMEEK